MRKGSPVVAPPAKPADFDPRWHGGLTLLAEAYRLARRAGVSPWEYAVEIDYLLEAGLTVNDLRHFLSRGWVEHADECTTAHDKRRKFRPLAKYALGAKTCFVPTDAGTAAVETLPGAEGQDGQAAAHPAPGSGAGPEDQPRPQWDRPSRTLTFLGQVVKRFRGRARDQMALLDLVQRLGWPHHVADALAAFDEDRNRKKRLHNALWRLNANQDNRRLRFHGYAEGMGIWWEIVGP